MRGQGVSERGRGVRGQGVSERGRGVRGQGEGDPPVSYEQIEQVGQASHAVQCT